MAPTPRITVTTIDEYLALLPPDKRAALQWVRRHIKAAAPGAEECISYGIPGFRLDGRLLVLFGAASRHCAFYAGAVVEAHTRELEGYDISKGTIRFPPGSPLPAALIKKLVKAQITRRVTARREPAVARGRGSRRRGSLRADDFRRMALSLNGVVEGEHMGHRDFRANGRIFATLRTDGVWGTVRLSAEQQDEFVQDHPSVFSPEAGAWGRQGYTKVRLDMADDETLGAALTLARQDAERRSARRRRSAPARHR